MILSVFKESELQLESGSLGVSLALGEVLGPAKDLIERFSWIRLASLTSLGVQKVLSTMVLPLLFLWGLFKFGKRLPVSR